MLSQTIASEFQRLYGWREFSNAEELISAIKSFMDSRGLSGSATSAYDVARHVLDLQIQVAEPAYQPLETPEQAAYRVNLAEGVGDPDAQAVAAMDELSFAAQVQQMSLAEFGAHREALGLRKSTFNHLAGL
jgi:hypothetical protein